MVFICFVDVIAIDTVACKRCFRTLIASISEQPSTNLYISLLSSLTLSFNSCNVDSFLLPSLRIRKTFPGSSSSGLSKPDYFEADLLLS